MKRNIVEIDQEKCNGCGLCADACAEGAIRMIDGKAKLVTDSYCDGLGACLGHCPMDAIKIIEREADAFDEEAVAEHLQKQKTAPPAPECGCPGSALRTLLQKRTPSAKRENPDSELRQWPVQLHLVPVSSPNWQGADLLLCADCVPVAYGGFQQELLRGKQIIIACPKLDNTASYLDKLTAILRDNDIRSLTVARMEVPCCSGIARLAENALAASGKDIPLKQIIVNIDGSLQ